MEKLRYDGNQITSWDKCDWRPQETEKPQQGTLKLSDAIRIGARLRPMARGSFFVEGRSCALGAAYEATYGTPPGWDGEQRLGFPACNERLKQAFPFIGKDLAPHPRDGSPVSLDVAIALRNDHHMTREKIADWLESQGY